MMLRRIAVGGVVTFCFAAAASAAVLYADVPVSDGGVSDTIAFPNTSRNVAVDSNGVIYVVYRYGGLVTSPSSLLGVASGIKVARSVNRGQSFETPVEIASTAYEAEIAVDCNDVVHVVWGDGADIYYCRSTDSGQTFSSPTDIGDAAGTVHLAVDAPYVYVIVKNGQTLYRNTTDGVGAFSAVTVDASPRAYSDVHVDPQSGDVYVQTDDPTVRVFKSPNHGASFSGPHEPGASIYYSTTVLASTRQGVFLYTSGSGSDALRIDVSDYSAEALTFGTTTVSQGRTLAVDAYSNVVDGYVDGANVKFAISQDGGETFGAAVTIAAGEYLSLGLNPLYADLVAVYESSGRIYCTVYEGVIVQPPTVETAAVSDITGVSATCGGDVVSAGTESVTARGVCWNTAGSPTISDNKTTDGSDLGEFTSEITGLSPATTYYVRAYATSDAGTAYGDEQTFETLDAAPDLEITVELESQSVAIGVEVGCLINVSNVGNAGATGVEVVLPLPTGTEFVGAWRLGSQAGQSTPLDATVTDGQIHITIGDLAAGEVAELEIVLRALVAGVIELLPSVSSQETPSTTAVAAATAQIADAYVQVVQSIPPICVCGPIGFLPLAATLGLMGFSRRRRRRRM